MKFRLVVTNEDQVMSR